MKTASAAMKAHLAQGQTTLAYLWKVKRTAGAILGFTTHDLNITYDDGDGAITYLASTGFTNTAAAGKSDLKVDNLEVAGFLDSESIVEEDIRAGYYDDAIITIRMVNWADLTMGDDVIIRAGTLGDVKMKNGTFTAEMRGLSYKLTTILGATYGPLCRATFGSGANGIEMPPGCPGAGIIYLCYIDVTLYRQTGSLSSVTDAFTIVPSSGLLQVGSSTPTAPAPTGWFNDGIIHFTSGALDGQTFEIKTWDGTTLILFLPLPVAPAPGDTFYIEPGCDKTPQTCQTKYSNIVNFRGESFIPGSDQILQIGS